MKTSSSTIWMDCITSPAVPGLSIGVMRCTQSEGINGVRELVWRFELGSVQREQRGSIEAPSSRRRHFDGVLRHSKRPKDTHPSILGARDAQPAPGRNLRQSRTQRRLPFERKILTRPRRVERRHQSSPVSTQHHRYIHYHALSTQSWWFWTQLIGIELVLSATLIHFTRHSGVMTQLFFCHSSMLPYIYLCFGETGVNFRLNPPRNFLHSFRAKGQQYW